MGTCFCLDHTLPGAGCPTLSPDFGKRVGNKPLPQRPLVVFALIPIRVIRVNPWLLLLF